MKNNLKELYHIQKTLKGSGYHDIDRISNEIQKYCRNNNIHPTSVLERIQNNEPWEYIKGESEFKGLKFMVNKNTLIPRLETEDLVDIAMSILREDDGYKCVVDVGTGSGCIIIFLAKKLCKKKRIKFLATDINIRTLGLAKKNSVLHKVNEKVSFLKTNLINDVELNSPTLLIANLPYVPSSMYNNLDKSVKDFEPQEAIDGGENGLKYYEELLNQLQEKVSRYKTSVLIEIEPSTLNNLKDMLDRYNISRTNTEVFEDYRGEKRFVLIHLSQNNG